MTRWLKRLWCRVWGHDWYEWGALPPDQRTDEVAGWLAILPECLRCGEKRP